MINKGKRCLVIFFIIESQLCSIHDGGDRLFSENFKKFDSMKTNGCTVFLRINTNQTDTPLRLNFQIFFFFLEF